MNNRLELTTDQLTAIISLTLDKTPDEIKKSESFEQSVYNMARTINSNIPELDLTGKASYWTQNGYIRINFKVNAPLHAIAKFYNSYFPETKPSACHGSMYEDDSVTFLAGPFIEKVLPAMKLWKQRPSELASTLVEDIGATMHGPSIMAIKC